MTQNKLQAILRTIVKIRVLLAFFAIYLVLFFGFWNEFIPSNNFWLSVYVGLILAIYFSTLKLLSSKLLKEERYILPVVLFFVASVVIVIIFGAGWYIFGIFKSTNCDCAETTWVDALYFSSTTFTTLGYGDFAPNSDSGKTFASIEALLGTTHMVAFFSIVITRLKKDS